MLKISEVKKFISLNSSKNDLGTFKGRQFSFYEKSKTFQNNTLLKNIKNEIAKLQFPNTEHRNDIYKILKDKNLCNSNMQGVVILILCWGAMTARNMYYTVENINKSKSIVRICKKLFKKEIDGRDAYRLFSLLRKDKQLKGMGPAYYTKLIFFLSGAKKWFIMDQWTARSINLLTVSKYPKIKLNIQNDGHYVSDKNTDYDYNLFCETVRNLTEIYNKETGQSLSTSKIEEKLFSGSKGRWRNYLKEKG